MANKQLTAKVKLNISDAERKLNKLNNLFKNLDKASSTVGSNDKMTKQFGKANGLVGSLNNKLKGTNSILGGIGSKLKMLASTYLGIMGMKAAITTSDTLTGTQNKLNNLNGGNTALTQNQMDKMYASANKVRMAYTDMASNASKSMTLAGGAFQGNMDNAIRFQEIMAETYALGGASAEEMSTSMYQMIQALGAGVLAGDELRSVREGAPLAYKAIEEFAQGVYNSKESLKDMASQGLITSEMVVAAVMDAGDKIDKQFEKTYWTFGQAWNRIKNAAVKAFEPVSNALRDMLNRAAENGVFEKIEQAFWKISKVIQIVFALIEKGIAWVVDNWNWLKWVIIGALVLIMSYYLMKLAVATYCAIQECIAWAMVNAQMLITMLIITIIIAAVLGLLVVFLLWKTGAINTCQAIVTALLIVGVAVLLVGILLGSIPAIVIGAVLIMLGVIFMFFETVCGRISGAASFIWAVIKNIGIWFNNLWFGALSTFWTFIGDILSGLSSLEPAFNAIAKLFGLEGITLSGLTQGAYNNASKAESNMKAYNNLGDAWNSGYEKGETWAAGIKESINQWGSQFQNSGDNGSWLDGIGETLGLNFDSMADGFPSGSNYDTSGAYNMPENLKATADNTGAIADSMELAEEDLEYLRKLADMEWKKEFTTANITVDMSNYNTINSDDDLDGIVTKLSTKLREELNVVANGVYV